MASYSRVNWGNHAAGGTKLGATNLGTMDDGIGDLYELPDAKGDLLVATAADTLDRLAVGTNDQVLVADSAQAGGMKWAAVPGTSAFVLLSTVTAKGDLLVGTGSGAVDNLAVGTNDQVLTADSGETGGMKWATVSTVPSAFSSYTPAWTSTGTAPSLGNGTAVGSYVQIGDFVFGWFRIVLGSTSTNGTGNYRFSVPVSIISLGDRFPFGFATVNDTGTNAYGGLLRRESATTVSILYEDGSGQSETSATAPMTPASGDSFEATFMYEAA